ncbi:MAG: hypothetical protein LIQ30_03920 [Planctomycetes bacterium]|nr:hypothetical protein [Planctomycetota bacterium]
MSTAMESTALRRSSPVRIAVVAGAEPDDWRRLYDRLNTSRHRLATLLQRATVAVSTFVGVVAAAGLIAAGIVSLNPEVSPYYLIGGVILPALLAGAACGQAGGNLFLRLWFRMDDATRRGFTTRLTLARCPRDWPAHVKRWLFTGDWLGSPAYDLRLPYVRIFINGPAPETCAREDALWREIHMHISAGGRFESGTNIREISYPEALPSWAFEVDTGDGYSDLQAKIGDAEASAWVQHLWRRACRQWPALGACDYPAEARRECFEMHQVSLHDGRDALVVVLRPSTFVLELEEETQARAGIAA